MNKITHVTVLAATLSAISACVPSVRANEGLVDLSDIFCSDLSIMASGQGLSLDRCDASKLSPYAMTAKTRLRREQSSGSVTIERSFSVKDTHLKHSLIKRFAETIVETALRDLS